jgi:diguanylate cyclase (GGDEF)-like protein
VVIMDDIFKEYRAQIIYALAALGAFLLLPFAVNSVVRGRLTLGAGTLMICGILLLNAAAIRRSLPLPVPLFYLFPPVLISLRVGIGTLGVAAVLWSYPAMILFYFILSRAEATLVNLALVLVVGGSAWSSVGPVLTLRVVATLLMTELFCHIFLSIIATLQARLHNLSIVDSLTGAFNRREMDRALGIALELASRGKRPVSLLSLDIDHFKQINDSLGHDQGDEALRSVVSILHQRLRKVDQLYRCGGEEFVILLPDTGRQGATILAEDLRSRVLASRILPDRRVSVSIGISEWRPGENVGCWLKRADQHLYHAKQAGRNQVWVGA